jgi:hypothetical protein
VTPPLHGHGDTGVLPQHPHSAPAGEYVSADPGLIPPLKLGSTTARPKRGKVRVVQLSETEKKARHNAHTRSSRLRIDNGLDRLKSTLRKVRPGLKLSKKADIVDEAVRLICETHNLQMSEEDDDDDEDGQDQPHVQGHGDGDGDGEVGGSSMSV